MPIGADVILISLPFIAIAMILLEDRRIMSEREAEQS